MAGIKELENKAINRLRYTLKFSISKET